MGKEDLLNTLEDLGHEEFNKFKWFLQQPDITPGFPTIKKKQLQTTNTWETVDLMVQTYTLPGAVEVTRKVLEKLNRNDLVQSLSENLPDMSPVKYYMCTLC
uniref:Pyrin domain-containing protein n=1 Tax=Seriola lalandi dorsalis TaxID=1841481 RepID=A0A3B4YAX5_SERLL